MPKSTVRKKKVYTPPAELRPQTAAAARKPSPTWLPATAVSLIVFAIAYLTVYYLTGQWFEMQRITAAAKERGGVVGWDLAHAAGKSLPTGGLFGTP